MQHGDSLAHVLPQNPEEAFFGGGGSRFSPCLAIQVIYAQLSPFAEHISSDARSCALAGKHVAGVANYCDR